MRSKTLTLGLVLAALMALSLVLAAKPAHAATTFTVDDAGDFFDHNVGDGVCDFTISEGDRCSLRAAIEEANHPNNPGPDTIRFDIGGSGVKTIRPVADLPAIKEQVTIDGYTQPGSKKNSLAKGTDAVPLIELDGSNAGSGADGLEIGAGASNSEIRGLVINRFTSGHGIVIGAFAEITGVEIEGNFIGTDATGQAALGNGFGGVLLIGPGFNRVKDNTIGGTEPEARNLISGNGGGSGDGVTMINVANNKVEGNLIGTKKDGTSPLGNTGDGVSISDSSGNSVGGALPGAANTIAFNNRRGVAVQSNSFDNSILGNSIFSSGSLGIDLVGGKSDANGRTPNDPGDGDSGPNQLQNFPEIDSAKPFTITKKKKKKKKKRRIFLTAIAGTLNSTPNQSFTVQLFSSPTADPSGFGEGQTLIGQTSATTDSSGNGSFGAVVAQAAAPVGTAITATATDPDGNTSEFSDPRVVG